MREIAIGRTFRLAARGEPVIQAVYKGVEIEMELHQLQEGFWKCDYTLIKHPGRIQTLHHGDKEFPTMDAARDYALQEARDAIDHLT
jgi:hypothetical protein